MDPGTKYLQINSRAVSGVFRATDPPPPLHPAIVSSPPHQRRGVHTLRAVRGSILRKTPDIGLASYSTRYNPSTDPGITFPNMNSFPPMVNILCGLAQSDEEGGEMNSAPSPSPFPRLFRGRWASHVSLAPIYLSTSIEHLPKGKQTGQVIYHQDLLRSGSCHIY